MVGIEQLKTTEFKATIFTHRKEGTHIPRRFQTNCLSKGGGGKETWEEGGGWARRGRRGRCNHHPHLLGTSVDNIKSWHCQNLPHPFILIPRSQLGPPWWRRLKRLWMRREGWLWQSTESTREEENDLKDNYLLEHLRLLASNKNLDRLYIQLDKSS